MPRSLAGETTPAMVIPSRGTLERGGAEVHVRRATGEPAMRETPGTRLSRSSTADLVMVGDPGRSYVLVEPDHHNDPPARQRGGTRP